MKGEKCLLEQVRLDIHVNVRSCYLSMTSGKNLAGKEMKGVSFLQNKIECIVFEGFPGTGRRMEKIYNVVAVCLLKAKV